MAKLRLQILARHLVEMEHRQQRAEGAAEDKGRKAAADKVETAAGFAASL